MASFPQLAIRVPSSPKSKKYRRCNTGKPKEKNVNGA